MTQGSMLGDFANEFHPLFLPMDGQSDDDYKPEPIRNITIYRIAGGNRLTLGVYSPAEITSEEQIRTMFGGGTYELVARRMTGHIYARRPLQFEGVGNGQVGVPAASAATPSAVPSVGASDRDMQMMMMFVQLLKQSSDDTKQMMATMMQMQQQGAQQNMQMMIAMMSAQTNAGASGQQAMATVLGRVLDAKSVGANVDPAAQAAKMLELAKSLKTMSGAGETNWAELIGGILAGLGALAQANQQQQHAPPNGAPQPKVIDVPANGAPQQPVS